MGRTMFKLLLVGALVGVTPLVACTADIHDNQVEGTINLDDINVDMTTDIDVDNVQQGTSMPVNVSVPDTVYLVEPSATVPAEKTEVAAHFQVYIDNVDDPPVSVTASTHIEVKIGDNVPEGDHKLICRLHKHDGTPTESKFELSFKVKAKVSTGG